MPSSAQNLSNTNSITTLQPNTTLSNTTQPNSREPANASAPLNKECILSCVLAVSPTIDLIQRCAQLNKPFREMTAPAILSNTGHLMANYHHVTPITVPIPLVPQFLSQLALTHASERDVSWFNITWRLPDFYNLGECQGIPISQAQQNMLAKVLIQYCNGLNLKSETITRSLLSTISNTRSNNSRPDNSRPDNIRPDHANTTNTPEVANQENTDNLLIVRAKAPVNSLSLAYQLPAQPTPEFVHCQVFPLTTETPTNESNRATEQFPFVGIPILSHEIVGPYSNSNTIEAQLFNAARDQQQAT